MSLMLPAIRGVQNERAANSAEKRAAEALLYGAGQETHGPSQDDQADEFEMDATTTISAEERLRTLDFEQMSVAEIAEARRMIERLRLPIKPLLSRRTQVNALGSLMDFRGTMRMAMRRGGEVRNFSRKKQRTRLPNLVVLCDISGSMSHYSRMVLHFLHAVANHKGAGWAHVHAFTFGTQLTNITRHLAQRDVDAALAAAGAEAHDWEGGTRIGACLHSFNRDWSRRVMGQGAVVLMISDGLDRDPAADLAPEMERLHLSAQHLIWVNPLLRWEGFLPKAKGIAAMLPHVDSFRAGHSVASLEALGAAIGSPRDAGEKTRLLKLIGV